MLEFNDMSPELFTMPEYDIELVNMLSHSTSAKRRFAAKKFRKTKDTSAGPSLLHALQKEMKSSRTWETQYHMIMALSDCSYIESLPYLYELANDQTFVPMISVAIGDAITHFENIKYDHLDKISYWLAHKQNDYLEGAIRAIAMNRMIPEYEIIETLIEYVESSENDGLIFWLAAASPGWSQGLTSEFLNSCLVGGSTDDIKKAAEAALVKKYLKWRPL
ncbi:hypothetical protein X564_17510 [Pseudoalteromonas agarivorans]|nr:hypothetical protein X564_17510 [Pseudoalteromonas agarivorans]